MSITSLARRTRNMFACSAFGHDMPAPEELQGVDVLARQHAPHTDAEGDREDHRQHDVVVARHFEDHGDGGHHRAGAAADHRSHADHGKGGTLMAAADAGRTSAAAKAPPIVAPINRDGEKIPPEEPDPRLSEVASSLQTKQQEQKSRASQLAERGSPGSSRSRRLRRSNGQSAASARTSTRRPAACRMHGASSAPVILSKRSSNEVQAADKASGGDAGDDAEQRIKAERDRRGGVDAAAAPDAGRRRPAAGRRTAARRTSPCRWRSRPAERCGR